MRLTREQRAAFFAGDCPSIKGRGEPPCKEGDLYILSSRLSLTVEQIRTVKAAPTDSDQRPIWSLRYTVHDRRDPVRLPRRVPPVHMEEWKRYQDKAPTEAEIRQAAEESGYTSNAEGAADRAESPSEAHTNLYAMESAQDRIARKLKEEQRLRQRSLADRLLELEEAMRTNPNLHRYLNRIERELRKGEARKRRDAA